MQDRPYTRGQTQRRFLLSYTYTHTWSNTEIHPSWRFIYNKLSTTPSYSTNTPTTGKQTVKRKTKKVRKTKSTSQRLQDDGGERGKPLIEPGRWGGGSPRHKMKNTLPTKRQARAAARFVYVASYLSRKQRTSSDKERPRSLNQTRARVVLFLHIMLPCILHLAHTDVILTSLYLIKHSTTHVHDPFRPDLP